MGPPGLVQFADLEASAAKYLRPLGRKPLNRDVQVKRVWNERSDQLRAAANRLPKTESDTGTGADSTGKSSTVNVSGQMEMIDGASEAHAEPEPPKPLGEYEVVTDMTALKSMIAELEAKGEFAFDTETTGLNSMTSDLVGLSFAIRSEHAWYVAVGHTEGDQVPFAEALAALRPLFEDDSIKKTAHNANFDMMVLASAGIEVKGLNFDTMIAAQLCGRRAIGLKQLALELFQAEMTEIKTLIGVGRKQIPMSEVPIETAGPYAAADADFTWRLKEYFEPEIDKHNARYVNEEIELPLLPVIIEMQRSGMVIDKSALAEMSETLGADIELIQQTATAIIGGRELNLASNRQVADLLIDELGAPKTRKTKTGYSMDASALDKIRETSGLDERVYQVADAVLKYRELTKLKSTYVDALPLLVNPATGRVHTSFNQVASRAPTPTFRTSRCALSLAVKSAKRLLPMRKTAGNSWRPTTRRSNCGFWRTCRGNQDFSRPSTTARTFMPPPPARCTGSRM